MVSCVRKSRISMQPTGWILILSLGLQGCDIAQERVYINSEPESGETSFSSGPTQAELVGAIKEFSESHGYRCRQHVKRWDEWSCTGPRSMRITLEPDRGKNRFVTEFTLIIRSTEYEADFRDYVTQYYNHMNSEFADAVVYAAR